MTPTMPPSFHHKPSVRPTRSRRHRRLTHAVIALLVVAAALNVAAFAVSSYVTTLLFRPFFDEQLITSIGSDAFRKIQWSVNTRVGPVKICYEVLAPHEYASPERCFSYSRDTIVITNGASQIFPSACGMLDDSRNGDGAPLEKSLDNLLHSLCTFPGMLVITLPILSITTAFVTAVVAAHTLFPSTRLVYRLHKGTVIGATLSGGLVLVVYLVWTSVVASGQETMHQGVSAWLTVASLAAFVLAAALAMVQVRTEVLETDMTIAGGAVAA